MSYEAEAHRLRDENRRLNGLVATYRRRMIRVRALFLQVEDALEHALFDAVGRDARETLIRAIREVQTWKRLDDRLAKELDT